MFKSLKRAMFSICLAAVFVLGCCVGSGQFINRETVLSGLQQALTCFCDLDGVRAYLMGFLPDIRERIGELFPNILEATVQKIL